MAVDWHRAPVRVLVLGRPGSGKGTQGSRLAHVVGVPHVSTGDLLRAEIEDGSPLGREIADHVARGRLVPDALVATALADRLSQDDACTLGFVLDGYPRTIAQAIALERMLVPDRVTIAVELMVPEREAAHRLLSRFVCVDCGHPATPKAGNDGSRHDECARCGGALRRRVDDDVSVVRHRFREFEECTKPLLEWLDRRRLLVTVDADRPADDVGDTVLRLIAPVLERAGLAPLEPGLTA